MANNTVKTWEDRAAKALVGRTITGARYLTQPEMDNLGWSKSVLLLTLDDGSLLFPSRDDEGNGGGALFGVDKGGNNLTFPVIRL